MISQITPQKRRPNRRSVFLDGCFAFGCSVNVIARFRLREGMQVSPELRHEIERGAVTQECFDAAMRMLQTRLHGTAELRRKLLRQEWGAEAIDAAIENLARMGYLDDVRFAKTRALSAAQHKKHGRGRAMVELFKRGVSGEVARRALEDVYEAHDSMSVARELAMKHLPRLRKLDPVAARRRLVGMLQRRGFDYDEIRPVVNEVLGSGDEEDTPR